MSPSHSTAAQNSAVTGGCKPVASWIKLCPNDFAAVVGITFFVCYVLWGVPLTLRLFHLGKKLAHHVSSSLSCGRTPKPLRSSTDSDNDVELDVETSDYQTLDFEYLDPYHSPTHQLHAYIASATLRTVPVPSPTLDMYDTLRLKQYRFPSGSPSLEGTPQSNGGFFDVSCYPSSDSDSDSSVITFASPLDGINIHTKRNTPEELDALVMGACKDYTRPASETSFDTIGFLDSYGYAAADNSKDLVDHTLKGEGVLKLPESPPPAYLELEPASYPGRITRSGIRLW